MAMCLSTKPQRAATVEADKPAPVGVVIVAAGSGERFGRPEGKSLVPVAGRPMVAWSVLAADAAPSTSAIVIVCREQDMAAMKAVCAGLPVVCPVSFARGGRSRQESVANGLKALEATGVKCGIVSVHDGARPLVTPCTFERLVEHLRLDPSIAGAVAGQPSVDTLKVVSGSGLVEGTPDRSRFWCVQTPQTFRAEALESAHARAAQDGFEGTDDASLLEHYGQAVACVAAQRDNTKVTLPEDLVPVEAVLLAREQGRDA